MISSAQYEHQLCVRLQSSVWASCSLWLPFSICFSLSRFHFFSLSLSLRILQEVIDIFEGVRDDQALRMAANLGFKGPLQRQVMCAPKTFISQSKEGADRCTMHTHIYANRYKCPHSQIDKTLAIISFPYASCVVSLHRLTCQVVYYHIWQWCAVLCQAARPWIY